MAYAAAVSLLQTLRQLQLSDGRQFSNIPNYPKSKVEFLRNRVCSLKSFLEINGEIEVDLETHIRNAIYEAEDIVDSHILAHFLYSEAESQSFCQELERVIQEFDSIAEKTTVKFAHQNLDQREKDISLQKGSISSSRLAIPRNNLVYGRHEDISQVMYRLITESDRSQQLQVVPIVGIAGIGKTTLAKSLYEDQVVIDDFDTLAWVTLHPEYCKRDVLLGLLRSMKKLFDEMRQQTNDQLAKYLYNLFRQKKYLVVLDNVRDVESWNDFKGIFPDYNKGSRIMLTTRDTHVADVAATDGPPHLLEILNKDDTWLLLRDTVFVNELCPPEHEKITEDIAKSCRGLPFAIVTIGRLLSWVSIPDWIRVASSINTCQNHDELVERAIYLSYKYLPQYLKACLLYLGMFPDSYEVPVSKLINLWIAEGFLEPTESDTLEQTGEKYFSQLVDRSLVSVCEQSSKGRTRTCTIDEGFRDFFMRKAEEENFFFVINKYTNGFLEEADDHRRLCIHKNIRFGIKDLTYYNPKATSSNARTLLYMGPQHQYPLEAWLDFKLLKVLDALKIRFSTFPHEVLKLVHLRYLAFSYNGELPASVCKLWNLQFLIILGYISIEDPLAPFFLPLEIWNMKELRHLQFTGSDLPDPSTADETDTHVLLEKLLTLSDVSAHSCTLGMLRRIPNLKKLGIQIGSSDETKAFSFFRHLDILHQLESVKCVVTHPDLGSQFVSSIPAFPPSLKKLSLDGCGLPWENITVIAELPNLEVLKLRNYAFRGPEWKLKEGEFFKLKFLLLEDMDLEKWILAKDPNFPLLKRLIIRHCYKLQEIPNGFGYMVELEMMEVVHCSPSVMKSAQQVKQEQRDSGNEDIQVDLYSSRDYEKFNTFDHETFLER